MRKKNLALMATLCAVSIKSTWAMDRKEEDATQNPSGYTPMILYNVEKDEEPIIYAETGVPSTEVSAPPLTEQKPMRRLAISLRLNLEAFQQPKLEENNAIPISPSSPILLSPKESPKSGRERRPSTPKTLPVRPFVGSASSKGAKSSTPSFSHVGRKRTTSEPQIRRPPAIPWSGKPISPKRVVPDREVSDQRFRSQSESPEDSWSEESLEEGIFEGEKRDRVPPRSRPQSKSPEDSFEERDPSPHHFRRDPEKVTPPTRKISFSSTDQEELRKLLREIEEQKKLREIGKNK